MENSFGYLNRVLPFSTQVEERLIPQVLVIHEFGMASSIFKWGMVFEVIKGFSAKTAKKSLYRTVSREVETSTKIEKHCQKAQTFKVSKSLFLFTETPIN